MKTFKTPLDIVQLDRTDAAYPLVLLMLKRLMITADKECQCWCPELQGYIIELDETDDFNDLMPVWDGRFQDMPFEHCYYDGGVWVATVILTNDFGLIWLLEDGLWIPAHIRSVLEENMDPPFTPEAVSYSEQ